jgi:Mor family transcriptional regulator
MCYNVYIFLAQFKEKHVLQVGTIKHYDQLVYVHTRRASGDQIYLSSGNQFRKSKEMDQLEEKLLAGWRSVRHN